MFILRGALRSRVAGALVNGTSLIEPVWPLAFKRGLQLQLGVATGCVSAFGPLWHDTLTLSRLCLLRLWHVPLLSWFYGRHGAAGDVHTSLLQLDGKLKFSFALSALDFVDVCRGGPWELGLSLVSVPGGYYEDQSTIIQGWATHIYFYIPHQ
ncbi:hypothetical protein BDV10DRAFT_172127 [Aspergillus recurvatus]